MSSEAVATNLEVTIKGPSDLKFSVSVPPTATVLELKGIIAAADPTVAVEHQRLIYSGRVLKDEDPVSKYSLKSGNTVHLVSLPDSPPLSHRDRQPSSTGSRFPRLVSARSRPMSAY